LDRLSVGGLGAAAEIVLLCEVTEGAERHAEQARRMGLNAVRAAHRLTHERYTLLLEIALEIDAAVLERYGDLGRRAALRAPDVEGKALQADLLAHLERDCALHD